MPTFTRIVKYVPVFNIGSYSIHGVVRDVMEELLGSAPRGAKCYEILSLIDKDGKKYLACTITLENMKGTFLDKALVISEDPAEAREKVSIYSNATISCRTCEGKLFYDLGRSRDHNYHVCAACGAKAQTLTETGASA